MLYDLEEGSHYQYFDKLTLSFTNDLIMNSSEANARVDCILEELVDFDLLKILVDDILKRAPRE